MAALTRFAKTAEDFFTPIHPEGKKFAAIAAAITLVMFMIEGELGMFFLFVTGWVLYFFRNPKRVIPSRPDIAVSPADGKVVDISEAAPPAELGYKSDDIRKKISIFLNVCDVHVNRVPVGGDIVQSHYRPGKFLSADLDKASEDNERQCIVIRDAKGREFVCVQIAGLVARRIVCDARKGMAYKTGDLYGIIRFGSRVDVYLPQGSEIQIEKGQYMIGGETVLACIAQAEITPEKEKDTPPKEGEAILLAEAETTPATEA